MKSGVYTVLEIVVFGLTYGGVIVIILSYLKLFQKKLNKFSVLTPLCIMGFLFIILIIFQFAWDSGYAALYVFFVSFIGLGILDIFGIPKHLFKIIIINNIII